MAELAVVLLKVLSHYKLDPAKEYTLFRVHGAVEGAAGLAMLLNPHLLIGSQDALTFLLVRLLATALLGIGVCSTGIGASRDCKSAAARSFAFAMAIFHAVSTAVILLAVMEGVNIRWLCMLTVHPPLAYLFMIVARENGRK
jgi:hypothetical protein